MKSGMMRALDRYVFTEFVKIFVTTALGFPILVSVIDLTDNLDKYLARNLGRPDIIMSYVYWLPDTMFMVLPAAVLFATVFTIGALTRHSEITAAKASGISFHRMTLPIFLGSLVAAAVALMLAEITPKTNAKREEILQERTVWRGNQRSMFAYAAEHGRVYKVSGLNVARGELQGVQIERKGTGPEYPTYVLAFDVGRWEEPGRWELGSGYLHLIPGAGPNLTFAFDSAYDRRLRERPLELTANPKAPQDMGWRELGRFIAAMERSGADVNELKVERMLKLAIPVTCIIIAMFGAPLATSTQRGGAAYGIGISLGTTIVFLMLIQLTKAIGGRGVITPEAAAWIPNALFAILGAVLLFRVRT